MAIGLVGAVAAGIAMLAAVVGPSPTPAGAAGLERFTSCGELAEWGRRVQDVAQSDVGGPATTLGMMEDSAAAAEALVAAEVASATGADADRSVAADGTGGTNVAVAGVDELDLVDRVDDRRALFASSSALVLVDLEAGDRLDRFDIPYGTQLTFDADRSMIWTAGPASDGAQTEVRRVALEGDHLVERGRWSTPGALVAARRVGDRLHLVVTDGFAREGVVPFDGGPVPCDQVWHPAELSAPAATLIATFSTEGDLAPLRATEVVGSGQLVHVTTTAAYLATPQWGDTVSTTIHRFDLGDLAHTGSGRVPGTLLNDFAMSDHDGYLRVAVTVADGPGAVASEAAAPIESMREDVAVTPTLAVAGPTSSTEQEATPPTTDASTVKTTEGAKPAIDPGMTTTTEPDVPTTTQPATTIAQPATTTTEPATTTTTEAVTTTTEPMATATTTPTTTTTTTDALDAPGPNDGFNRIYVLDTDGDLDVVGRTGWFGHAGETLHGIRFDGPTAYAVTFLQTDPFYVVDLADPTDPRVVGELQLPGFSGYLHPVGAHLVIGFGPDASGAATAKLFDVSDPAAPKLVDTVALGGDAPIVYDHHALTTLASGRFATPVIEWGEVATDCAVPEGFGPTQNYACPMQSTTDVVELEVRDGRLREVRRTAVATSGAVARVLPVGDGWGLLGEVSLELVDAHGAVQRSIDLT